MLAWHVFGLDLWSAVANVMYCAQNGGTEASMEWVLAHMDDQDFNDPLPAPAPAAGAAAGPSIAKAADPDSLAMLTSMGFTSEQVLTDGPSCFLDISSAILLPIG